MRLCIDAEIVNDLGLEQESCQLDLGSEKPRRSGSQSGYGGSISSHIPSRGTARMRFARGKVSRPG